MEYPENLGIADGRFRLKKLIRGWSINGLWVATDQQRERDVWVTIRRMGPNHALAKKLDVQAFGIPAPLYIGPPDLYTPDGQEARKIHFCVVDEIPAGEELANVGRLSPSAAIQLGRDLCEVVATWAAVADGYILRGLRPETIFVSTDTRRFIGATPRPYLMLGNQNEFDAYPSLSFDPPTLGPWEIDRHDAVFTVALLIWWSVTGVHAYAVPGDSVENNAFFDRRLPFDGPPSLGNVLERALVSDPAKRIDLEQLRAGLDQLA